MLVDELGLVLPDFGKVLAIDGKVIDTHARARKVKEEGEK